VKKIHAWLKSVESNGYNQYKQTYFVLFFVPCILLMLIKDQQMHQLSFNIIISFSLLHVSALKMPSSGFLLKTSWDICPVVVEIYPMDGWYMLCVMSWYIVVYHDITHNIYQASSGLISTTTAHISQKVVNKFPEDGILNSETCKSEKIIILNDNWWICWSFININRETYIYINISPKSF
jgi:hypothetical protein